jgi:hypothetical protein
LGSDCKDNSLGTASAVKLQLGIAPLIGIRRG